MLRKPFVLEAPLFDENKVHLTILLNILRDIKECLFLGFKFF
jgi:hypothetical protein